MLLAGATSRAGSGRVFAVDGSAFISASGGRAAVHAYRDGRCGEVVVWASRTGVLPVHDADGVKLWSGPGVTACSAAGSTAARSSCTRRALCACTRVPERGSPGRFRRARGVGGVVGCLAVYTVASTVHLLRLADGRDRKLVTIKGLADAQIRPAGVFYAADVPVKGGERGLVSFVPIADALRKLR